MNVSAVCIGCSLSFRSTSRFGSFCVCTLGCRVVAHENVSFNRMARRGAEPLARATTCTQNTMHRPPGALNTHGSTEHTHEHEQRRPCTRHTRVRRRPPYGFLSHTHVSVNCALNKGAVLLCSCSYAGSPCEIASRLPSVRIYHASDGPLRPRANQHIRGRAARIVGAWPCQRSITAGASTAPRPRSVVLHLSILVPPLSLYVMV